MNTVQVSNQQIAMIWFCSLAMLSSPMSTEEKIQILEEALIQKILANNQSIQIVETGLEAFDNSLIAYINLLGEQFKSIDLNKLSTGSPSLDSAFRSQVQELITTNFTEIKS